MVLNVFEIEFLGVKIVNSKYALQPHIGHELLKFHDSDLIQKRVQKFVGTVNYISDFIHKLSSTDKPLYYILRVIIILHLVHDIVIPERRR